MSARYNVRALGLTEKARAALSVLAHKYATRRTGWDEAFDADSVDVVDAELMRPGRPGLVDVIAMVGSRTVHVAIGLRAPGDESRFLADTEDEALGIYEDEWGLGVAVDAMSDAEIAASLVELISGIESDSSRVRRVRSDAASTTLAFEERIAFTTFDDVGSGRHPGLELFLALDEAGFNHLAAPITVWRRGERDLGIVQEYLAGGSTGWALATTSVRDFYATGGSPERAGGDFGGEALRLGIMTARMHLALDRVFGRRRGDVGTWVDQIEAELEEVAPALLERADVRGLLAEVRELQGPWRATRTHGDFQLRRVCRTDQGWYVMDFSPGGFPSTVAGIIGDDAPGESSAEPEGVSGEPSADPAEEVSGEASGEASPSPAYGDRQRTPVFRSPLADVSDMLWSFGRVAATAAQQRDPNGEENVGELALAWERRNRRAFLAGYLSVPGVNGLLPQGREAVAKLATVFELARAGHLPGSRISQ